MKTTDTDNIKEKRGNTEVMSMFALCPDPSLMKRREVKSKCSAPRSAMFFGFKRRELKDKIFLGVLNSPHFSSGLSIVVTFLNLWPRIYGSIQTPSPYLHRRTRHFPTDCELQKESVRVLKNNVRFVLLCNHIHQADRDGIPRYLTKASLLFDPMQLGSGFSLRKVSFQGWI